MVHPYVQSFQQLFLVNQLIILSKHLSYFQACGKQSEPFYHLSYCSSYYSARPQLSRYHLKRNGDSRINVSQLGTPKHTPRLCPRHKQDQSIPFLLQGPGPRPNLDSKPPLLNSRLSVVLRPPPSLPTINRSGKSQNPRQESNEPFCSHKQVCAQNNKSVT